MLLTDEVADLQTKVPNFLVSGCWL